MFISDQHKLIEDTSLMAQYGTLWQNPIVDATCSEDISGTNPNVEVAMLAQYPYNDPVVNDPDQRIWKMWDNSPEYGCRRLIKMPVILNGLLLNCMLKHRLTFWSAICHGKDIN